MEKQRIIRKLTDIANDISLLDIEVTADEIQAEMAKIGGVTDEFSRGYATAVADIPRAVKQARERKEGSEMKQLINDELNELLLDIRESLGNVLDHPGSLEDKEDEIKAVFKDIQKAIDMTEPIKLTEDEEEVYKKLIMEYQDYLKCFPERDNNIFYAVRDVYEDWGKWDKDKTFLPALRKFLNEVAE